MMSILFQDPQWIGSLTERLSKSDSLNIYFLSGISGHGQSEAIELLAEHIRTTDYRRCLIVREQHGGGGYAPVVTALADIGSYFPDTIARHPENAIATHNDMSLIHSQGKMNFSFVDCIYKLFLEYTSEYSPPILLLRKMQAYPTPTVEFLLKIFKMCKIKGIPLKVLADIYDDDSAKELSSSWINRKLLVGVFENFVADIEHIRFKSWPQDRMRDYLHSFFSHKLTIDPIYEDNLIETANGNPGVMRKMLLLLKERNYIIRSVNDTWRCRPFDLSVILTTVRDDIIKRYHNLEEPLLKDVLHMSAAIGANFDRRLLENPFSIAGAYSHLRSIEEFTHLITELENQHHVFESKAAWETIRNFVDRETMRQWCYSLGCHYDTISTKHITLPVHKRANYSRKAFEYFYLSGEHQKGLRAAYRTGHLYMSIQHYYDALHAFEKAHEFCSLSNETPHEQLFFWHAECHRELMDFSSATLKYRKYLTLRNDLHAKVMHANSLYCNGYIEEPRQILLDVIASLQKVKKMQNSTKILALAMLAAVEETRGDISYKKYYYEALELSHQEQSELYYSLLRRSVLNYPDSDVFPLLKEAEKYFRKVGNLKELAMTLHNMANVTLFSGNIQQCSDWLNESISILESYGNYGISAIGNSLAIVMCMTKRDYSGAAKMFARYDYPGIDAYQHIVLQFNQANCHRCLGDHDSCGKVLDHIEASLDTDETRLFLYQKRNLHIHRALLLRDQGESNEAYKHLLEYWKINSMPVHRKHYRDIFVVTLLVDLAKQLDMTLPPKIQSRKKATSVEVNRLKSCGEIYGRLNFAEE